MDWKSHCSESNIYDYAGFVYLITNLTNQKKYIGRKYLMKSDGTESDWREYYGSSDPLKEDIKLLGKHNFKREILSFHKTKQEVNYEEARQQFLRDVLYAKDENGEKLYYNRNILMIFFTEERAKPKFKTYKAHKSIQNYRNKMDKPCK